MGSKSRFRETLEAVLSRLQGYKTGGEQMPYSVKAAADFESRFALLISNS